MKVFLRNCELRTCDIVNDKKCLLFPCTIFYFSASGRWLNVEKFHGFEIITVPLSSSKKQKFDLNKVICFCHILKWKLGKNDKTLFFVSTNKQHNWFTTFTQLSTTSKVCVDSYQFSWRELSFWGSEADKITSRKKYKRSRSILTLFISVLNNLNTMLVFMLSCCLVMIVGGRGKLDSINNLRNERRTSPV